jgi:hypothetical protein
MLIAKTTWWIAIIVAGLVGALGVAGVVILLKESGKRREKMPNERRDKIIVWVCAVIGVLATGFLYYGKRDAIVCTDKNGGVATERLIAVGTGSGETWVVNDSSEMLRIEEITYGIGFTFDPHPIPPHTQYAVDDEVEFIGPGSRPPHAVRSTVPMDSRRWLTWGGERR